MKILALDISKSGCGMAVGDATRPPHTAVQTFSGILPGAVGFQYSRWLREQILINQPDMIAYEAPLRAAHAKGSQDTVTLLTGLAFLTDTVAYEKKIFCQAPAIQSWRKAFLGHGRPADPKGDAVRMCELLGWRVDGSHDRADAAGVWAWSHLNHGNTRGMHKLLSAGSVRGMAG